MNLISLVIAWAAAALILTPPLAALAEPAAKSKTPPKRYVNSIGMEFNLIPAGEFIMGSPASEKGRKRNELSHKVFISKPFYMQTTEVTLGQWRAVMGKRLLFKRRGPARMPITKVSWNDAKDFIARLNTLGQGKYRLPTEAEWEYACRAGGKAAYPWGEDIDCTKAMYANNSLKDDGCASYAAKRGLAKDSPAPVKSYPPNAWGLYDMNGNVWELCSDWFGPYGKAAVKDPKGASDGDYRVRRGGSWFRDGLRLRCAKRNFADPESKYRSMGFRVVREVPR